VRQLNARYYLFNYIDECHDKGFDWGRWDCLRFVDGAVKAQRGYGFADDWFGSYTTPRGAALNYAKITRHGIYNNIIEGLDDRLNRLREPQIGSVVAVQSDGEVLGYSLGIKVDERCAFVGTDSLVFLNLNNYISWSIE